MSDIDVEMTDDDFIKVAKAAHAKGQTLNDFMTEAVLLHIVEKKDEQIQELVDLVKSLEAEIEEWKLGAARYRREATVVAPEPQIFKKGDRVQVRIGSPYAGEIGNIIWGPGASDYPYKVELKINPQMVANINYQAEELLLLNPAEKTGAILNDSDPD